MARLLAKACGYVFDSFNDRAARFTERYAAAEQAVRRARLPRVLMTPQFEVRLGADLEQAESTILEMGFEGVVLRDPQGPYIFGRVPARSQVLMKLNRRAELVGNIVQAIKRRGRLDALLVNHPDWQSRSKCRCTQKL